MRAVLLPVALWQAGDHRSPQRQRHIAPLTAFPATTAATLHAAKPSMDPFKRGMRVLHRGFDRQEPGTGVNGGQQREFGHAKGALCAAHQVLSERPKDERQYHQRDGKPNHGGPHEPLQPDGRLGVQRACDLLLAAELHGVGADEVPSEPW